MGLTNGSVRDLKEVRQLGFHFFAKWVSVSHAYVHAVEAGIPVKVGGLWVKPGDLIHADQHGVVTIPLDIVKQVPSAVKKLVEREGQIINYCQSKNFTPLGLKEVMQKLPRVTMDRY
jgi:regulator of RNase E activity RraA